MVSTTAKGTPAEGNGSPALIRDLTRSLQFEDSPFFCLKYPRYTLIGHHFKPCLISSCSKCPPSESSGRNACFARGTNLPLCSCCRLASIFTLTNSVPKSRLSVGR